MDNNRFLRLWFEVDSLQMNVGAKNAEDGVRSGKKWFAYNKGGEYRRWYGNRYYVINWFNDGKELKDNVIACYNGGSYTKEVRNENRYFCEGMTWSTLSTGNISFRYSPYGCLFDSKGSMGFVKDDNDLYCVMAYLNSKVTQHFLEFLSPTLDYNINGLNNLPYSVNYDRTQVRELCRRCIGIAKKDWDSFEISWDYTRHPLISRAYKKDIRLNQRNCKISDCYDMWMAECDERFQELKSNEETLNTLFIGVYKLQSFLTPKNKNEEITVRKADVQRDTKSLISYAVGCMFGRYSLDIEGLAYAGGDWKEAFATKYKTFKPDEDGIIPITDEEYFKDDIVARFVDFIRIVYGEETLEENLKFIADALGNKGDTSRAVIRNYFLNDFYKDHCNTYSVTGSGKRPIYWLFDSGKQNGFKALIYIHRYTPDTVGLIRSVYLHNAQAAIQNSLQNSEYIISTTTSATERARETKKKDKYVKQLNELRPYYQALSHIALQRIQMDLDDGVKKNYQLFQGVEVSTEGKKKQTINLLAKI